MQQSQQQASTQANAERTALLLRIEQGEKRSSEERALLLERLELVAQQREQAATPPWHPRQ
jgi:hypothetical protein